ncbi:MAG: glycosyltransferase, partial [Phaeodactylibacter sp.]|nr:glycosyltransferase [Phaeodactylibacter sp.]
MSAKICHITTVHYAWDTRILHRECVSLVEQGFEVHLIVAEQESFTHKGVQVHNIQSGAGNRLQRMRKTAQVAYRKAVEIDADLYHFHDPELLPIGRKLQRLGKPVIYDVHEHVPHQIRTKAYLPKILRPIIATAFEIYENRMVRKMDGVVTATDLVQERFLPKNKHTVAVNNYPRLDTLHPAAPGTVPQYDVTYVGLINEIRGIRPLLDALALPGSWKLCLVGYFQSENLEKAMRAHPGWQRVEFMGRRSREEVADILAKSRIGLVTFLPAPNHNKNQPNKLFEYMAAGLP